MLLTQHTLLEIVGVLQHWVKNGGQNQTHLKWGVWHLPGPLVPKCSAASSVVAHRSFWLLRSPPQGPSDPLLVIGPFDSNLKKMQADVPSLLLYSMVCFSCRFSAFSLHYLLQSINETSMFTPGLVWCWDTTLSLGNNFIWFLNSAPRCIVFTIHCWGQLTLSNTKDQGLCQCLSSYQDEMMLNAWYVEHLAVISLSKY